MIKSNPEIAVRMLRKYSIRLRETTKQIEQMGLAGGTASAAEAQEPPQPAPPARTVQAEALALLHLEAHAATCFRYSRPTPSSAATTR